VLYLDISVEEASKRGDYGNERYEKVEFQRSVREVFERLCNESSGGPRWVRIRADRDGDEIARDLTKVALETIEAAATAPIQKINW
jgi:dTMP kinase